VRKWGRDVRCRSDRSGQQNHGKSAVALRPKSHTAATAFPRLFDPSVPLKGDMVSLAEGEGAGGVEPGSLENRWPAYGGPRVRILRQRVSCAGRAREPGAAGNAAMPVVGGLAIGTSSCSGVRLAPFENRLGDVWGEVAEPDIRSEPPIPARSSTPEERDPRWRCGAAKVKPGWRDRNA
jgi:hypothetical protein